MAASGLTLLQIVNRVLRRLREDEVAAYNTTAYSTHITDVINGVKSEIEQAFHWHRMRETYAVVAAVDTTNYTLTGSGMNAVILDGWNSTFGNQLTRGTNADFNARFFGTTVVDEGPVVSEFCPAGLSTGYDLQIDIWPSPAAEQTLKFVVYVPQADLAANATVPLVPQDLLIEEVIARMLVERGEEGAQPPAPGEKFIRADLLSAAIAREAGHDDTEMDWVVE